MMKKATAAPERIVRNFIKLKLWFSLDSNRMVVEMCKKIPITSPIIALNTFVRFTEYSPIKLPESVPRGAVKAKMIKSKIAVDLLICDCKSIVIRAIAIGILCKIIPMSREVASCR